MLHQHIQACLCLSAAMFWNPAHLQHEKNTQKACESKAGNQLTEDGCIHKLVELSPLAGSEQVLEW
eukprot:m.211974 g.211974  ORF g.211974 m.211974 type:complete len:66 (-) comp53987_c0_seq2:7-204(-)